MWRPWPCKEQQVLKNKTWPTDIALFERGAHAVIHSALEVLHHSKIHPFYPQLLKLQLASQLPFAPKHC